MDVMAAVIVGVSLLVACTLGGLLIVRLGFTRDAEALARDAARADGRAPSGSSPVDPRTDPNAAWRAQMKSATAASGAACTCPDADAPTPDCPIHRWDFA